MAKGKRKAVGYIRVSTTEQATEGVSLEAQETRVRAFCEAKQWELIKVYSDKYRRSCLLGIQKTKINFNSPSFFRGKRSG